VTEADASAKGPLRSSPSGLVLALYAGLLLAVAVFFPWWRMECRAPQYGQRVLVVNVSPLTVGGDVREIDILGHYVGMQPLGSLAPFERKAAPFAVVLVALAALALPFLPRGWPRRIAVITVVAAPLGFLADMYFWQRYSVTHLDPKASLNMLQNRVQARLLGDYAVAQFKVHASLGTGFWLVVVAAMNALGFLVAERRERRAAPARHAGKAALAAAALLLFAARPARAATLEVGAGRTHRTVASALAVARAGDEIVVGAGVYHEHVRLDRALTLRGEPGAVIDGGGTGTVVEVDKGPCAVTGLTIRNSGDSLLAEDAGIKLTGAAGCRIAGNRLDDVFWGILAISSPDLVVADNRVRGKDLPMPRRGDGIRLYNSNHAVVEGNVLERSRDLAIWQSNDVVGRKNRVHHSRYGLHYMYCDDSLFEDNVFADNQVGAAIMYSRRLTLRRNTFARSRGPSAVGVLFKVGDDILVEQNLILDNTTGFFLEETPSGLQASCTIRANVVAGCDVGVSLQPSVTRAVFTENAFIATRTQAEVTGRTASGKAGNFWSKDGRGNYWSDYVGFDADGDGIGDTPYRAEHFFEDLTGRWPAVGLLRMGPANARRVQGKAAELKAALRL